MILMTLAEIAEMTRGELLGENISISGVGIDTRTLNAGDLYIAIQGDQFDGHDFVEIAVEQGACAIVCTRKMAVNIPQIIVTDTRLALAELAGAVRNKLKVKVCAITGSNGKTTVKEMIAVILSVNYQVLFTQGNFNNEIGVPLTLLRLQEQDEFAVIEMGANHIGEIAYSSQYAKPDVAVITNVSAAHIEGFGSIDGVAQAKAEIVKSLAPDGVAILNADDIFFSTWKAIAEMHKVISFGLIKSADVHAENILVRLEAEQFKTSFDLLHNGQRTTITLNLAGQHNVKNALAASAACLALGITQEQIKLGLESVEAVKGRMQLMLSTSGLRIINDSYNANPASLMSALAVLKQCQGEKWLILGAFGELGDGSNDIHAEMGQAIKGAGVKRLFATGALAKNAVNSFGLGAEYFHTQEALITTVKHIISKDVVLLVKGSRAQKMEVVVDSLLDEVKI